MQVRRVISILAMALVCLMTVFTDTVPASSRNAAPKEITFGGSRYSLAFSDDFDSWDDSKWAHCPEQERQDAGGEWRDACSRVADGNLVITCDVTGDGTPISGAIRSTGEYEQRYGLYHIRFKAEKADGLWYAFWLLTDKMNDDSVGNGATDGAELDIIELVPHTRELVMSVHWDGYGEHLKSRHELTHVDDSFYDGYHDLWYLWNEDGYRLYMDGTDEDSLLFDFPGDQYGDGTCAVPCDLIISAEYGVWGGDIHREQLPAHLYVDFVRVYSEDEHEESNDKNDDEDEDRHDSPGSKINAPAAVNPDTIIGYFSEKGHPLPGVSLGKMKQGPVAGAAFSASCPKGWKEAFTFNMAVNGKTDNMLKDGMLTIMIPAELQKSGRTFALLGLDRKGRVLCFDDTDMDPATLTSRIIVDGYAYSLIYKD